MCVASYSALVCGKITEVAIGIGIDHLSKTFSMVVLIFVQSKNIICRVLGTFPYTRSPTSPVCSGKGVLVKSVGIAGVSEAHLAGIPVTLKPGM